MLNASISSIILRVKINCRIRFASIPKASISEMEISHFMDQFIDKDVEVLSFIKVVGEYFNKALRDFDVNNFASVPKEGIQFKDEDEDLFKRRDRAYPKKYKWLHKCPNKLYGHSTVKVSISKCLGRDPTIISTGKYEHSNNMERIMQAQAFHHGRDVYAHPQYPTPFIPLLIISWKDIPSSTVDSPYWDPRAIMIA